MAKPRFFGDGREGKEVRPINGLRREKENEEGQLTKVNKGIVAKALGAFVGGNEFTECFNVRAF